MTRTVFHYDPEKSQVVPGPAPRRTKKQRVIGAKDYSGMSYQIPPDIGPAHLRRIQSGPEKGRICWTTREEAVEAGKWIGEATDSNIRYDPD